jgi:hypothetical protein
MLGLGPWMRVAARQWQASRTPEEYVVVDESYLSRYDNSRRTLLRMQVTTTMHEEGLLIAPWVCSPCGRSVISHVHMSTCEVYGAS